MSRFGLGSRVQTLCRQLVLQAEAGGTELSVQIPVTFSVAIHNMGGELGCSVVSAGPWGDGA